MKTEAKLAERIARIEQELQEVKQQLAQLVGSSAPTAAFQLLEQLWDLPEAPMPSLSLQEARHCLAQGLPPKWGSRLLQMRRAKP